MEKQEKDCGSCQCAQCSNTECIKSMCGGASFDESEREKVIEECFVSRCNHFWFVSEQFGRS